ncbi:MAG: NAD(P)-dependent glycerol-3-phosphate dehydrogenase [Deltaproteobacteria bacterium]|nr:NAD(P)-dependent glycerol-3-phosphate dehydrogenase [Deltaproteobacteria bacterium]
MELAVIGAGTWGTALAHHLDGRGHLVALWAYEEVIARQIRELGENQTYLPGIPLSPRIQVTHILKEALVGARLIVLVAPSFALRAVMVEAAPHVPPDVPLLSATKGLEEETQLRMTQVVQGCLPQTPREGIACLSGPSFAREVARGLPTAVCVAAPDAALAAHVGEVFASPAFRVHPSCDVVGVELGGAVKNVVGVAAGICEGLGLGFNAQAAVITQGLAEMARLGEQLGADRATFWGLAGLGDLVLTCMPGLSRNRTLGVELGRGRPLAELLGQTTSVIEGVRTARAVYRLAARHGVPMPLCLQVYRVLYEGVSPPEILTALGR